MAVPPSKPFSRASLLSSEHESPSHLPWAPCLKIVKANTRTSPAVALLRFMPRCHSCLCQNILRQQHYAEQERCPRTQGTPTACMGKALNSCFTFGSFVLWPSCIPIPHQKEIARPGRHNTLYNCIVLAEIGLKQGFVH